MVTMVDGAVSTEQFALRDTFKQIPEAKFETVSVVAHEAGSVMPYLWASAPDLDALYDVLQEDSTTKNVQRLSQFNERDLYRIEWQPCIRLLIYAIVEEQGTLLGIQGQDNWWMFKILFPDHDAVSATYDLCQEYGVDLIIRRVNSMTDMSDFIESAGVNLSEKQYEALTEAFEKGYYGVPRGKNLRELANELDVSHQALSERIRRGHRLLISRTLCDSPKFAEIKR